MVYSLSGSTAAEYGHLFAVDPATGALTLRQTLDHETAVEYSLSVAASDRGPSATPAFTQVTSHRHVMSCCRAVVDDVGDHALPEPSVL